MLFFSAKKAGFLFKPKYISVDREYLNQSISQEFSQNPAPVFRGFLGFRLCVLKTHPGTKMPSLNLTDAIIQPF